MNTEIIIDPYLSLHYAAFYVQGLNVCFPKKIKFSHEPFQSLKEGRKTCLLFILKRDGMNYKVAIDFHDANTVDLGVLKWSDSYAKINYHKIETIEDLRNSIASTSQFLHHKEKIFPIPPSFGINIFTPIAFFNFIGKIVVSKNLSFAEKKTIFLATMRMIIKRRPLKDYSSQNATQKYVFHLSSLWAEDTAFVNFSRANFIRAVKSTEGVKFEGGLVDVGYDFSFMGDISDIVYTSGKIKLSDYIEKTKQSFVVFNGPSVKKCHGWKIAEYLAMGKAIISTKFHNHLPIPLEHGKNIYFVENDYQSLKEAIEFLLQHPKEVLKLELGARKYWRDNLLPEVVVNQLVNFTVKNK